MSQGSDSLLDQDPLAFLSGGGEMGRLIRSMDWSKTPLGPAQSWPQSLRTAVSLCLASNFPINVIWGPQRVQIYNDGYWPICGVKHPHSMGQDYKECWFSAWPAIGASFERASAGETAFLENQRMFLDRNGYLEETFFTFSHSPIRDETGGVGGLFHPVTEMTQKTLAERRLQLLRDLAHGTADAKTVEDVCALVAQTLATQQLDLPFVLLYLVNVAGTEARLVGSAGLAPGTEASPERVDLAAREQPGCWPLAEAVRSGSERQVDDLESRFQAFVCGPYPEPPKSAFVQPIHVPGLEHPLAILVAGVSPRRPLDEPYRIFYAMLRESVTNALVAARAYEEERKKSEALAELDRAKTLFFTNISHEFRTPLTLLLGPVEDMLAKPEGSVLSENRESLQIIHRHSLRLLKLVNTLLDFSRIEAGRMQAVYERTDIAALTCELASMFRSAVEKAGMRLLVDCPAIDAPVYLDREMWEKIVLNLLSNAFKFTFAGEIQVRLRLLGEPGVSTPSDRHVELTVRDTGVGIPAKDLPHICERFYRVEGAKGRSHEGTGIGLALACELVKLHGGGVRVESVEGRGTTFTVSIPTGSAHLPPDRMDAARAQSSTSLAPNLYVEEAQRWLPSEKDEGGRMKEEPINGLSLPPSSFRLHPSEQRPRIVLADDNTDMREYVRRLLSQRYDVEAAPDGAVALKSVRRQPPDLVLADVMMPQLDGFALLRELRADAKTRTLPVILLSARAGEEARVEGLGHGADDYLIKPFSARELLARVDAHLALARLRREAGRRKDEFLATLAHELRNPLAPIRSAVQIMRLAGNNSEVAEQARQTIERQMTQLVRLVDDLLDVSRIASNRIDLRKERVPLSSIIQSAVEISLPLIEASGHELTVALPPQTIWLNADLTRMAQVIANLLNNAAKYTAGRGRIWVTAELTSRERERPEAVIRIRDSGVGIPQDMLPRIFEMFAQVESSRDRAQGGLGIGLTLVKSLVEMHGGSVQAMSAGPDQGSEFIVRLPVASPVEIAQVAERTHKDETDTKAPMRRILVVDDNRDSAETLGMLLQMMGNEVRIAHDGPAALEEASAFRPDLALVDIGMPGMSGYEVAQRLRDRLELREMVLVALTGWGQEEDYRRSYEAGFHHHLTKPADLAALQKLLASLPARCLSEPEA